MAGLESVFAPHLQQPIPAIEKAKVKESRFGDERGLIELIKNADSRRVTVLGSIDDLYDVDPHGNEVRIVDIEKGSFANKVYGIIISGENGESVRCIFKPHSGERQTIKDACHMECFDIQEEAAYWVSSHFGLDLVPPTGVVEINNERGSAQVFMDPHIYATANRFIPEYPSDWDAIEKSDDYLNMALLDFIIIAPDRNLNNYMIERESGSEDRRLIAIDNGVSFHPKAYDEYYKKGMVSGPSYQMTTVVYNRIGDTRPDGISRPIPEHLLKALIKGQENREQLDDRLTSAHLPDHLIEYMWQRVDYLIQEGKFLSIHNTSSVPRSITSRYSNPHPLLR